MVSVHRYLAQQNLFIQGQQILWGHEYDLEGTAEVVALVANFALLPQLPDGSFAQPSQQGVSAGACCRNMAGG